MIHALLAHRASVSRPRTVFVDGTPVTEWVTVAEDVRVLVDTRSVEPPVPTYTAAQQTAVDRAGLLMCSLQADIKGGDRITVTRPVGLGTYAVSNDPAVVAGLSPEISHREFRITEVPG